MQSSPPREVLRVARRDVALSIWSCAVRSLIYLAILAVGLLAAWLMFSSCFDPAADNPVPIRNPYVKS